MLDFPASPTNGQLYNGTNGVTYQWMSSPAIWVAQGSWTPPPATGTGVFYPGSYGAVGGGVVDDTIAMQAAITAAAGKILDGAGLTYKITNTLTGVASNTTLRNMTLDFSAMPNLAGGTDYCLRIDGAIGATVNLTANTLINSSIIAVNTATFAVDQLVFLTSTKVWDTATGTTYGQYGRVKSIDSGAQLTLYDNVQLNFNTADTANIAPVTPVSSVSVQRVKFIGGDVDGRNQIALWSSMTENLNVTECEVSRIDFAAIALSRSYKPVVDCCRIRRAVNSTTAYGITVWAGTYGATISNCHGENVRHTVTLGDIQGINLYTLVIGNAALNSKDAGFDSHSAAMYTTYANNRVEMASAQSPGSSHDGIVSEGGHTTIIGNTVIGPKGVGIYYQPMMQDGTRGSLVVSGNTIVLDDVGYVAAISSTGILVLANSSTGASINRVSITGNSITGGLNNPNLAFGIQVNCAKAAATISNVSIVGNQITGISTHGILIRGQGTGATDTVEITGNSVDTSGFYGIYVLADEAGAAVSNVTGGFNILKASSSAIRLQAAAGSITTATFSGNIAKSPIPATNAYVVSGTVINAIYTDADTAPVTNVAGATITITRATNWYTFSRGTAQVATLAAPANNAGYVLNFLNTAAQTVDSASANVVPLAGGAVGTPILPATIGKWAMLRSDGTNWRIVQGN